MPQESVFQVAQRLAGGGAIEPPQPQAVGALPQVGPQSVFQAAQAALQAKPLTLSDAFSETFNEGGWKERLPFFGGAVTADKYATLWQASSRMEQGSQTREDEDLLLAFLAESQRPKGIGYMVGDILLDLPGFAVEFWVSGGLLNAAKKGGLKLAGKGLREAVEKAAARRGLELLGEKVAAKEFGSAVGVAARTLAQTAVDATAQTAIIAGLGEAVGGSRIRGEAWRRALPELSLTEEDAGRLAITFQSGMGDFYEELPAAIQNELIEIFSEKTGEGLVAGMKRIPGVGYVTALQTDFVDWITKKYPGRLGSVLTDVAKGTGFHGMVGEWAEERLGGALRGATGVDKGGILANAFPGLEQQAAELIAFGVPGAVGLGGRALTSPGAPAEIPEKGYTKAAQPVAAMTEADRDRFVEEFRGEVAKAAEVQGKEAPEVEVVPAEEVKAPPFDKRGMDRIYVRSKTGEPLPLSGKHAREGAAIVDVNAVAGVGEVESHETAHDLELKNPGVWDEFVGDLEDADAESLDAFVQGYQQDYEAALGRSLTDPQATKSEGVARYMEERAALLWIASTKEGRQALADAIGNRRSFVQAVRDWLADGLKYLGVKVRKTQEKRLAELDLFLQKPEGTTRVEHLRGALLAAEAIDTMVGLQVPSERIPLLPAHSPFKQLTQGGNVIDLPETMPRGEEAKEAPAEKPVRRMGKEPSPPGPAIELGAGEESETPPTAPAAPEKPKSAPKKKLTRREQHQKRVETLRLGGADVPFRVFLRANGGLRDDAGDFSRWTRKELGREANEGGVGLPALIQPQGSGRGMMFDEALRRAYEAGYIDRDYQDADKKDLEDLLERNALPLGEGSGGAGAWGLTDEDLDEMARAEGFKDAKDALEHFGRGDDYTPFAVARRWQAEEQRQHSLFDLFRESEKVVGSLPEPSDEEASSSPLKAARRVLRPLKRTSATVFARRLAKEYADFGQVSLIGRKVKSLHDLAVLAQVYRSPVFETFRYFFVKDGRIVWQTGVTSRMPGSTLPWLQRSKDQGSRYRQMFHLQATLAPGLAMHPDGLYIMHNHPSANPTPSPGDKGATAFLVEQLPPQLRFLGHIVINHGKYAVLDKRGATTFHEVENLPPAPAAEPHPLLGKLNSHDDLVHLGYRLRQRPRDTFQMVGLGGQLQDGGTNVQALADVPIELLGTPNKLRLAAELERLTRSEGTQTWVAVNVPEKYAQDMMLAIEFGYLRSALVRNKSGDLVNMLSALRRAGGAPRREARLRGMPVHPTDPYPEGVSRFAVPARHVSPHKFDRFSTDYIGTGEGVQAYGWGLYFYTADEVGRHYRKKFAHRMTKSWRKPRLLLGPKEVEPQSEAEEFAWESLHNAGKMYDHGPGLLSFAMKLVETSEKPLALKNAARAIIENYTGPPPVKVQEQAPGYEVDLAPEEDEYLLWDEPLSKQSEKVKEAVERTGVMDAGGLASQGFPLGNGDTGGDLYRKWALNEGSQRDASLALLAAGIRGIKYLDGTSRSRSINRVRDEFKGLGLGQDAEVDEVLALAQAGEFTDALSELVLALNADDWLGFDYPAQAITVALSRSLSEYDPGPRLVAAARALEGSGATFNYVVFDASDVEITGRFALAPREGSPAFKRWFGDSKVVDEDGKPLVVYHGTRSAGTVYDVERAGENTGSGTSQLGGSFFTPDPAVASRYAEFDGARGDGGVVQPVYLSLQNPYRMPLREFLSFEDMGGEFTEARLDSLRRKARQRKAELKADGYDGIVIASERGGPAGRMVEYVAFRPEQIKSATGNVGTFDPSNPDIRFAVPKNRRAQFKGFDIGEERTFWGIPVDRWIRGFSDKELRVLRFEQALGKAVERTLGDDESVYKAIERLPGRVESSVRRWEQKYLDPLKALMKREGITREELDEYLYALHAEERDRWVRKQWHAEYKTAKTEAEREEALRKLETNENPSGLPTKEREKILDKVRHRPNVAAFREAAQMVAAINANTRRVMRAAGLISQKTLDAWEAQYKHYVPLRTSYEDERSGTGRGLSIAGPESKRVKGRWTLAHSPLTYSLLQAQRAYVRGHKNEVGNTFLLLAEKYGDLLKMQVREEAEEHDTELGELLPREPLPTPYEFSTKVQGKQVYITVEDALLRRAMQGLGEQDMGPFVRFLAWINRGLSNMNTSWDPDFVLSNLVRDLQTAGINLGGERSLATAARVVALTLSGKPQIAVHRGLKGVENPNDEWLSAFHRLDKAGGLTAWYHVRDFKAEAKAIDKELAGLTANPVAQVRRALGFAAEKLEDLNRAVENGVRLAAFKVALEEGATEKQAASVAKNLTVNFNRRGEWGAAINAFYLFYNASVQGSVRLLTAMRRPGVQRIALSIAVASAFLDAWNRSAGGDDDDGIPFYDKIPEWVKQRNLIIMSTDGSGDYIKIPLPYGYNVFHAIGQKVSSLRAGAASLSDVAVQLSATVADSFNPLGSAGSLGQFLSPTLLDPVVQLGENQTFYGAPIRPEAFDEATTPQSQLYWSSVSPVAKDIAAELNRLTGGDKVVAGAVDVSPEDLEHLFDFASGGLGRFVSRIDKVIAAKRSGEDLPIKDTPILRRFLGEKSESFDRQAYMEQRDDVRRAEKQLKEYEGEREEIARLRERRGPQIALIPAMRDAESKLRKLRKQRRAAEEAGRKDLVSRIEESMAQVQAVFSKRYRAALAR